VTVDSVGNYVKCVRRCVSTLMSGTEVMRKTGKEIKDQERAETDRDRKRQR